MQTDSKCFGNTWCTFGHFSVDFYALYNGRVSVENFLQLFHNLMSDYATYRYTNVRRKYTFIEPHTLIMTAYQQKLTIFF